MISSSRALLRTCVHVSLAFTILRCGSGGGHRSEESDLKQFFKNAVRRDANSEEVKQVVKLSSGCAAFLLASTSQRPFFGTAKHCVNYSPISWCDQGGSFVSNDGRIGRCERIVASDESRDIFVFEAAFSLGSAASFGFRLSAKEPAERSKLAMIGYPMDKYRQGKLTVTENCWILKTDVASPYGGNIDDRSARHNCTTYGGNSGGPMILAGTFTVVGLPFSYVAGDYNLRDSENIATSAYMAKMSDFVKTHSGELKQAGIAIVE